MNPEHDGSYQAWKVRDAETGFYKHNYFEDLNSQSRKKPVKLFDWVDRTGENQWWVCKKCKKRIKPKWHSSTIVENKFYICGGKHWWVNY